MMETASGQGRSGVIVLLVGARAWARTAARFRRALLGREVLAAAGVDQRHFGRGRQGRRPPGRVSRKVTLPIGNGPRWRSARRSQGRRARSGGLGPERKVYRIVIL